MNDTINWPQVGDNIEFGHYNSGNGYKPILWRILKIKDTQALLITEYGIDCKPYNEENADVTWSSCSLRKWLNKSFLDVAFCRDEKEKIIRTTVKTQRNPLHADTDPGRRTEDMVFLLSMDEVKKLLDTDKKRRCSPTDYAVSQGAFTKHWDSGMITGWWWLRTPGYSQNIATDIRDKGTFGMGGAPVDCNDAMVRPALWVDLDALYCGEQVEADSQYMSNTIDIQTSPVKKTKQVINTIGSSQNIQQQTNEASMPREMRDIEEKNAARDYDIEEQPEDELIF